MEMMGAGRSARAAAKNGSARSKSLGQHDGELLPGHGGNHRNALDCFPGAQIDTSAGAFGDQQLLYATPGLHAAAARFDVSRRRGGVSLA